MNRVWVLKEEEWMNEWMGNNIAEQIKIVYDHDHLAVSEQKEGLCRVVIYIANKRQTRLGGARLYS